VATKFLKQYEILIRKSAADLSSAKVLLIAFNEGQNELDLEIIFFHLQQCAEKLIKALLDFNKIKFPHTHDLKDLINLLEDNKINPIKNIDYIVLLSQYAVEGRYAIIHDDLDNANDYIVILEELLAFVRDIVGGENNEQYIQ